MVCELKLQKLFGHLVDSSQAAGEGSDPGTSLSCVQGGDKPLGTGLSQ